MPLTSPLRSSPPASAGLAGAIERFLLSPWSLLLAVLLAFVLSSYSVPLTDIDEGAFSEATREMLARGNLVSPTLNGAARHDKPILIYWAQAASVTLFGQNEFGFRLPSIVAALLWMWALFRFARRHGDLRTALVATLVMALSLQVGIIAKAAIADALLNLFICLALFGVYDYFRAGQEGKTNAENRRLLLTTYAVLGLGFLTKGPVAVMFPLLIGSLFFVSAGAWRPWLRALLFWPGWLLFLAIVVPWHVMVYIDQGDAFFRGFYLKHNLDRYTSTFEGHGGNYLYYVAVLPFVLLPFTGWLLAILGRLGAGLRAARAATPEQLFERFLILWFGVVFIFFSFSNTQLPHYLMYGCTPLFILLARHRLEQERRWLAFAPVILFGLLVAFLPNILEFAASRNSRPFEGIILAGLTSGFGGAARWWLAAFAGLLVVLALWRRLPVWQGLVVAGLLQALVVFAIIFPQAVAVTQGPVRAAGLLARQSGETVVAYKILQPSFSVYRQAITPSRPPLAGETVLTRVDRLAEVERELAPLRLEEIYRQGFIVLAHVVAAAP
ncbi:MAG: glycosyltransferase family 39 protein [Proteobacteria bacterium]|nr:glycosyltransferase family 39 protein [Pseudomonadota bacterium]